MFIEQQTVVQNPPPVMATLDIPPPGLPPSAWDIIANAAPMLMFIMALLAAGAISAIVITVWKLTRGGPLSGGSAYISALRLGAPLLGLLGAVYGLMNTMIGIMATNGVPFAVVTPGLAEDLIVVCIGLFVGIIAVVCHAVLEARIDRDVLRA